MAPPSQLSIATASVIRLLKEETSYRTELESQRKRLQILQAAESGEDEDGNRAWNIGQQACALHEHRLYQKPHWKANRRQRGQGRAIQETEAVFGPLREKISTALEALESLLVCPTLNHSMSEFFGSS